MIPSAQKLFPLYLLILMIPPSCLGDRLDPDKLFQDVGKIGGMNLLGSDGAQNLMTSHVNSTSVTWLIDYSLVATNIDETRVALSKDALDNSPSSALKFMVNVTYQLIYSELSKYHKEIFCHLRERLLVGQWPEDYQRECRKEVFSFSAYDSKTGLMLNSFDHHCNIQQGPALDLKITGKFAINNLLPHQSYKVEIGIYRYPPNDSEPVLAETKIEYICLPPGRPQYPPQANLASFSLSSDPLMSHDQEEVNLYWRPLPRIFAGSNETRYEVCCWNDLNEIKHNSTTEHLYDGHLRIRKPADMSYLCRLRSKNSLGYATGSSPIIIPDKDHRLDLGREFKLYAYAVSSEEYWLEWTPIEVNADTRQVNILPRNITKVTMEIQDGFFSIYWCDAGRARGCSNLAGIAETKSLSSYNLVLPPASRGPLLFGLSYTRKSFSTGIIWSKCVADLSQPFVTERVMISQVAALEHNHTALSIYWDFTDCDSQVAIIESYEVNFCQVSELTGCSVVWSSPGAEDLSNFKFESSSERCTTILLPNRFHNEAIITDLSPSSRYIIRLRYILTNGTANPWSEPKSAVTLSDPRLVDSCLNKFKWNFGIVTFGVCLIIAICCTKSQSWYSQYNIIQSKFKQTTENICSYVTDVTASDDQPEVPPKYCFNEGKRSLTRAQSELSLSFLAQCGGLRSTNSDSVTCFEQDGVQAAYNHDNQIFDYIPKDLIEGVANATSQESSSGSNRGALRFDSTSEQDKISVDSNPLIWDAGSDNEFRFDFNNNQTSK